MLYSSLKKRLFFLAGFVLLCATATGQDTISGNIRAMDGQPLIFSRYLVLQLPDSSLVGGGIGDDQGAFGFIARDTGRYCFVFQSTGFVAKYYPFHYTGESLNIGTVKLVQKSTQLGTIDVVTDNGSGTVIGDTSVFSSGAYKMNADASAEDLVKKLPGVTIQDGKMNAQGEEVKQVYVDGKVFFGNDPNAVLKNIPAEMIDKVQIYDKKSAQAQATGIDDGETTKTINIVTKQKYKNGTFGRVYAGYGTENLYQSGFSVNNFKDDRRLSFIGQANNINQQNYSSEDISGINQSGGRGSNEFSTFMGNNSFFVSQQDGISETYATGLNYVDKWGKKADVSGSYFFNLSSNNRLTTINRTYITNSDYHATYTENSTGLSDTYSHRFNLKFAYDFDTLNSFEFRPQFSFQQHDGSTSMQGFNFTNQTPTNTISTLFSTEIQSGFASVPMTLTHKFRKPKRVLSLDVQPEYDFSDGDNSLFSETYSSPVLTDSIDQQGLLDQNGLFIASELTYAEPLGLNSQLVFSFEHEYSKGDAQKYTYREIDGVYSEIDTQLTNTYLLSYQAMIPALGYKWQKDKITWNLDLAYQTARLSGTQEFPDAVDINKHFETLLPSVQFSYKPARKKNFRVSYTTRTQTPDITELQDVIDNSNPVQLKTGNPDLRQEYFHSVSARYNTSNPDKSTNFFGNISANLASDYIANSTFIAEADTLVGDLALSQGTTLKQPVNLSGYYSLRGFASFSSPLKAIKCNISFHLSAGYTNKPSLINGEQNDAGSSNFRATIGLTSNISENIDFSFVTAGSYTIQQNSIRTELNTQYYNHSTTFKMTLNPFKGSFFEADLSHQYYEGLSSAVDNNYITANAAMGYKFLEKKNLHLKISAYDIFNQNNSVSRIISETYFEDKESNVINRYFMATLIYKFNHFSGDKEK